MSKRTIKCKMVPTPRMSEALSMTCRAFADACNVVLDMALKKEIVHAIQLQKATYKTIRKQFDLSANLAIRAIRRVSAALTIAKKTGRKPKLFRNKSIAYDARIFDYRGLDETVSLTTVHGRIHVPIRLGKFQRDALRGKRPTAAVVVRDRRQWNIHIIIKEDDPEPRKGPPMGVDLGIRNTAATSNGTLHSGKTRQKLKAHRASVRASLQSKGTRGTKRILKRLSGREARRIRHENHVLSKAIVDEAIRHNCGVIRMERLTHIRQRTKTRSKHLNHMIANWSFCELQQFVKYKARRVGLRVEFIDPAYTSQTCAICGVFGDRCGDEFVCTTCGKFHADINAAKNIAAGGAARSQKCVCRKPARIDGMCKGNASHVSVKSLCL